MTKAQSDKFMAAIKAAGITTYQFDTDLGTHLYNDGKNAIAIPDNNLEAVVAIRGNFGGSHPTYANNVQLVLSDYADVHEIRTGGTSEQIRTLVENLGITLTEDQVKIVVNIDKGNYDIKPETGNYQRFHYLTQNQYEALSDEEKAKYDSGKEAYEKAQANYIGQNVSASITL